MILIESPARPFPFSGRRDARWIATMTARRWVGSFVPPYRLGVGNRRKGIEKSGELGSIDEHAVLGGFDSTHLPVDTAASKVTRALRVHNVGLALPWLGGDRRGVWRAAGSPVSANTARSTTVDLLDERSNTRASKNAPGRMRPSWAPVIDFLKRQVVSGSDANDVASGIVDSLAARGASAREPSRGAIEGLRHLMFLGHRAQSSDYSGVGVGIAETTPSRSLVAPNILSAVKRGVEKTEHLTRSIQRPDLLIVRQGYSATGRSAGSKGRGCASAVPDFIAAARQARRTSAREFAIGGGAVSVDDGQGGRESALPYSGADFAASDRWSFSLASESGLRARSASVDEIAVPQYPNMSFGFV